MPTDTERDLTASQLGRLMGIAEAAGLIRGRNGQPPHVATLRKWADPNRGYRSRSGVVVVLRTVKVSGNLLTLEEWCEEFERARIRAGKRELGPKPRPKRTREAAQRRAKEWLDAHGVK